MSLGRPRRDGGSRAPVCPVPGCPARADMDHPGSDRVCTAGFRDPATCPDYEAHAIAVGYYADLREREARSISPLPERIPHLWF